MLRRVGLGIRGAILLMLWLCLTAGLATIAEARTRHALVVGVGNYREASGLSKLLAPKNDAEQLKAALEASGVDFVVDILTDDDVKDKAAFEAGLKRFLSRVRPDDEVLFYFSGHGFHVPERGNFFLLPDAKSSSIFVKDLGPAARELDTQEKRDRRYRDWIAEIAISEAAVERALVDARANVVIIIADACRNLVGPTKGASIVTSGIGLPRDVPFGTYRLYSASAGQVSLDSLDRSGPSRNTARKEGRKEDAKRETSLFTRVLLQELQVPRLEINVLFSKVKIEVREQARNQGVEQIPDFQDSRDASLFYFRQSAGNDMSARCATAPNELAQLRFGAARGAVSRNELERKRGDLAPCGEEYATEIDRLLRFESQGVGALSTSQLGQLADVANVADPVQACDLYASSPFDPNRPQGVAGVDVQKIALDGMKSPQERTVAIDTLRKMAERCEAAVQLRPRVARYKFNLARTNYSLATLASDNIERFAYLVQASRHNQDAVDQGYVAAYNNLALMHQNAEFYALVDNKLTRRPADRRRAFELLKRGADLGHVVAQYNLGMAYKNGDLGLEVAAAGSAGTRTTGSQPTLATREALAYQYLSRAAEAGYVPAMIETAIMQCWRPNMPGNCKRAEELLEVAASRGSWEAMFQRGFIVSSRMNTSREGGVDAADAVLWYSRAAEAGDPRAQTRLAKMLLAGDGLPAPQPDAAARYLRLAAASGDDTAQMILANRLRDGKVMFRPRTDGVVDGGAEEIRRLYVAAFAHGNPWAGLHLSRLFRTGFPAERPSDVIPKSPLIATNLLWDTIDKTRRADPASDHADPQIEVWAAVELIQMYDAGEGKGVRGPDIITQDQGEQLKADYGDINRLHFVRVLGAGPVHCRGHERDFWVLIWDGRGALASAEAQFDWFERRHQCKELTVAEREEREKASKEKSRTNFPKEADLGVPKRTRDVFKREFDATQKDKDRKRGFVDRMIAAVNVDKSKGRKR